MKKILIILPALLMCTLTACDAVDKEHAVIAPVNYDAQKFKKGIECTFEISPYTLYDMLENKESFVIEFYRPSCGGCMAFQPVLEQYINATNYQWYRLNTELPQDERDFFINVVMVDFASVLGGLTAVPTVYYIKDGNLSYELSSNKFESYTAFSKIANKHFIKTSLYTVSTLSGLYEFFKDKQNAVLYVFDNTSSVSVDVYKTIYSKSAGKSNPVMILYKNQMHVGAYYAIMDAFGRSYTDNFVCLIENGEIKKTVDYMYDDGASFKEYITSYLG